MDLTQLEMFNAVAEAGSITRAAAKCIACRRISLPVYVNWKQNWGLICLFARISVYVSPAGHNFYAIANKFSH